MKNKLLSNGAIHKVSVFARRNNIKLVLELMCNLFLINVSLIFLPTGNVINCNIHRFVKV